MRWASTQTIIEQASFSAFNDGSSRIQIYGKVFVTRECCLSLKKNISKLYSFAGLSTPTTRSEGGLSARDIGVGITILSHRETTREEYSFTLTQGCGFKSHDMFNLRLY